MYKSPNGFSNRGADEREKRSLGIILLIYNIKKLDHFKMNHVM